MSQLFIEPFVGVHCPESEFQTLVSLLSCLNFTSPSKISTSANEFLLVWDFRLVVFSWRLYVWIWIHWCFNKMAASFYRWHFQMPFVWWKRYILIQILLKFVPWGPTKKISRECGLVLDWWQAINLANDDTVHWCHMVPLSGYNELPCSKCSENIQSCDYHKLMIGVWIIDNHENRTSWFQLVMAYMDYVWTISFYKLTRPLEMWQYLQSVFSEHVMYLHGSTSCEIVFRWMPLDTFDDWSAVVQAMAWCCKATIYYLSQCWPRYLLPDTTSPTTS